MSLKSFPALAPPERSRKTVHAAPAPKLLLMMQQFKSFRELLVIPSLPGLASLTSRLPTWLHFSQKLRISRNLQKAGSSAPPTHTGEIINTNTFTLSSQGLTQALTDEFICGMVSKDNIRGRNRFQLGRFAPGKTSTSSQLVIRLTPLPHGASAAPSTTSSRDIPLTLEQADPYAIYFFQSSMLRVLTREGIRPKRKSPYGSSSLLKVQPTDTWGPVGTSQLRGRSDACLLIDMHASLQSGTQWIQHASDGCYGTDQVPLTPQFLLAAFRFSSSGTEAFWFATSAAQPARTSRAPATFLPHTDTVEAAQMDTRADMRLDAHRVF